MVDASLNMCVFFMDTVICILAYIRCVDGSHVVKILGWSVIMLHTTLAAQDSFSLQQSVIQCQSHSGSPA